MQEINWEEVGVNRWWGLINDAQEEPWHVVTVTLQSCPVEPGNWQDRWVWSTEPSNPYASLHSNLWWETREEAMDDFEALAATLT